MEIFYNSLLILVSEMKVLLLLLEGVLNTIYLIYEDRLFLIFGLLFVIKLHESVATQHVRVKYVFEFMQNICNHRWYYCCIKTRLMSPEPV